MLIIHPVSKAGQRLWLVGRVVIWLYGRSCVWSVSLWLPSVWPALADRECLIQLLLPSWSTAPGRSLLASLHTLMELHVIYPPYANLSPSPHTLSLTQNYYPTFPTFPPSLPFTCLTESATLPPRLPVSWSISLSLSLSLCPRKTPTYCSSAWVLSGRQMQTPTQLVSILPAVFSLIISKFNIRH